METDGKKEVDHRVHFVNMMVAGVQTMTQTVTDTDTFFTELPQ